MPFKHLGAVAMLAAGACLPWAASRADEGERARVVQQVAHAVVRSGDAQGMAFAIVDKTGARLHVYDALGRVQGTAPVLLGLARGDHSVPGIGERRMSEIRPHERTTPAGRFVAEHGRNVQGEDIIWVDYEAAVSMHRVRATNPRERRLERLASPTIADNRISYGCINVPADFYDRVLKPTFRARHAVVYVLPETRPVHEVLGFLD
ncbi:L,D-transpeptidase [Caldimonas thermodepolymerans]|jgi:hypothetical protein|nr:L,D-transpeptidase [Caldimonas thermodepolymerans]RDH97569.1 hypothetical protein DES46_10882 [Caldimonas thermodepolymerans]TCP09981.1 hypothetical protein EV676_101565 [Caldimonas thermodepolymerans]UZG46366.1 L,D-transpeptidase [Caldimonas thermodepolymerans]